MPAELGPDLIGGWGRTALTAGYVRRGVRAEQVPEILSDSSLFPDRGVVARGLGRSYGDPAQNAGGLVLDMTALDKVISFDGQTGTVHTEAGVSLDTLARVLLPTGWFLPVTPGTRQVTVGGAIAADVHGKNHHRDGSFGRYVTRFGLATADGTVREVSPETEPALFWATTGGMGLTGVMLDATIRLIPVQTSSMLVDTVRAADLDQLLVALEQADHHRYSVAWLDCLARGRHMGRGVVTSGEHATHDQVPVAGPTSRSFAPRAFVGAPSWVPTGLLNRASIAAFNQAWYRKTPRSRNDELQGIGTFFHPLDGVRSWNRLYGPRGLLQYQCVVPDEGSLRAVLDRISTAQAPSFLTVLKRLGPGTPGPLSFPRPGWTLTLDFPVETPGLSGLLDGLDRIVAGSGGALYLAKDSRMAPDLLAATYPRLAEWSELRDRVDPHRRLRSDQSRRLSL
ncbi:MAG TPA: FAD-binding oxidoreductase [Candidatus Nanopelagicales bacterium]